MPLEKRGASWVVPFERFELDDAALALPRYAGTGRWTGVCLLDESVPAIARGALSRPARRGGTAGLADVKRFRGLCHELHRIIQIKPREAGPKSRQNFITDRAGRKARILDREVLRK